MPHTIKGNNLIVMEYDQWTRMAARRLSSVVVSGTNTIFIAPEGLPPSGPERDAWMHQVKAIVAARFGQPKGG